MADQDRKSLICAQSPSTVTGIDFVSVADPADQRRLLVFFLIDPDALDVDPFDILSPPPTGFASIEAETDDSAVEISALAWDRLPDAQGVLRTVLAVDVAEPGGFQFYRLRLTDPASPSRIDRFFNATVFSFKQGCPSPADCAPRHDCPDLTLVDWPIDYLARDFESFRSALMDFAAQRYPDWRERIPADIGSMLAELMAALGDEFSYVQDRYAREAYLETQSQRRSLAAFAELVDYQLDPGLSAGGLLQLTISAGGAEIPAGLRYWAAPEGRAPIAFELGSGLRGHRDIPAAGLSQESWRLHAAWNGIAAHVPDPSVPCLPLGARELWVVGEPLTAGTLPGAPDADAIARFWIGRPLLIETRPTDPGDPVRRVTVIIDEPVEVVTDQLCRLPNGAPTVVTRLHWREEDALPFELDQSQAFVSANLVPATAGLTVVEHVAVSSPPAGHGAIPTTVERAGAYDADSGSRAILHRHSLGQTSEAGLGWLFAESRPPLGSFPRPEIIVEEVQPDGGPPESFVAGDLWQFHREILRADELDRAFTLEPGAWREIIGFDRIGERIVHVDYAADEGLTLRFGDGTFGRRPSDDTVFRATYRTGPGRRANLPADTVVLLAPPTGAPRGAPVAPHPLVTAVRNPFALDDGRDPEDFERARRMMPEAFRALVWRAVIDEDYEEIAERLDWVQQAGAVTRWTGSWLTTFVTPDPKGAFDLAQDRRSELERLIDCVRQAGREAHVADPVYVNVDIEIGVCIEPSAYFGEVRERIVRALVGPVRFGDPPPFFHPNNFGFGDPLWRTDLEACIAIVPGVLAVEQIMTRRRGETLFTAFEGPAIEIGDDRILQVRNDPRRPDEGSIRILNHETEMA